MKKYHIERNTVQETLIIPLFARKVCSEKFPDSVLVFDSCNQRGAKLMTKTWLKEAGIKDVSAFFSLEDEDTLYTWSSFKSVSSRSYMRGYRDIYKDVSFFHKLMIKFCEKSVRMRIVKICF